MGLCVGEASRLFVVSVDQLQGHPVGDACPAALEKASLWGPCRLPYGAPEAGGRICTPSALPKNPGCCSPSPSPPQAVKCTSGFWMEQERNGLLWLGKLSTDPDALVVPRGRKLELRGFLLGLSTHFCGSSETVLVILSDASSQIFFLVQQRVRPSHWTLGLPQSPLVG